MVHGINDVKGSGKKMSLSVLNTNHSSLAVSLTFTLDTTEGLFKCLRDCLLLLNDAKHNLVLRKSFILLGSKIRF